MRVSRRSGITNGVALIIVILVVAIPTSTYYAFFNQPITKNPTSTTSSGSGSAGQSTTSTIAATGAATDFVASASSCGFGLTYGSPGGEGCFVFVLNNSTSTLTASGTCNLTFGGQTYPGTFSYSDALAPGQSSGKVTCGSSSESPPAGAGTKVSGEVFFTNGQYVEYNGTATS